MALKRSLPEFKLVPEFVRAKRGRPPRYHDRETLVVGGFARTYWQPPRARETRLAGDPEPLLLCLHGFGSTGSRLGWWTGLSTRAPQADFLAVFPDAVGPTWDDHGCGRVDGNDDYEFIVALIDHLVTTGAADPDRIFVTGVSAGATFAERLVRASIVHARGVALVAGTARAASRDTTPISAPGTPLLMFAGTRDPLVPYTGGDPQGVLGRNALRTIAGILTEPGGHESVGPEQLAAEWVAANGCSPRASVQLVETDPSDPPVRRLIWLPAGPEGAPVVYYRIDGGGHGWPGASPYAPVKLIGRIPQHFDATEVVLDFARRCVGLA